MPTAFTAESALELVERLTRTGNKEDGMAFTVLEEQLQRKLRRMRREGVAEGRAEGRAEGHGGNAEHAPRADGTEVR